MKACLLLSVPQSNFYQEFKVSWQGWGLLPFSISRSLVIESYVMSFIVQVKSAVRVTCN